MEHETVNPLYGPLIAGTKREVTINRAIFTSFEHIQRVIERGRKATVFVLSGGALLGPAHLGAVLELKRMIEFFGRDIDCILGNSVGSLMGFIICSGLEPNRYREMIAPNVRWSRLAQFSSPIGISLLPLRRLIDDFSEYQRFDEMPIPLIAVAYSKDLGPVIACRDEDLAPFIQASCSTFPTQPVTFVDPDTGEILKLHDGSFGGKLWDNPVALARHIFPEALIFDIDLSHYEWPLGCPSYGVIRIRPFNEISSYRQLRLSHIRLDSPYDVCFDLGVQSVRNQIDRIKLVLQTSHNPY